MPKRNLHGSFIYFINEREEIRKRRESGQPPPWTDNAVLRDYRFTNIVRREDKVSRWLIDNWYEPFYNHKNILLAATLGRYFNLPSSLESLGFPDQWDVEEMVQRAMRIKGVLFNGAYKITGRELEYPSKQETIIRVTVNQLLGWKPDTDSMEECHRQLKAKRHFGPFMAGQVVADLRIAMAGKWSDRLSWAPMGPGSKRGMNRYFNREVNQKLNQQEFEYHLRNVIKLCKRDVPEELYSRMEAQDWQGCFCEFEKFQRGSLKEGRPKQKFKPSKENDA